MKKLLLAVLVLSVAFFSYGCQTASTPAASMPTASAQAYASSSAMMASGMMDSMAGWASSGTVGGMSIAGATVGGKTVTGPDSSGWYHIVESVSLSGYSFSYDVYVKLTTSASVVSGIDVYGTSSVTYSYSGSTYTYSLTYGSGASSPYHGAVSGTVSNLLIAISGSFAWSTNYPSETNPGSTDSIALTYTFSNFSLPVTTGNDYPTGTITVAVVYNSATQPNIVLTYNGTSTATFAYNGTTTNITVYPTSVD